MKKLKLRFTIELKPEIAKWFLEWKELKQKERGTTLSHNQAINEIIHMHHSRVCGKPTKK
jgi:hypothetical protein